MSTNNRYANMNQGRLATNPAKSTTEGIPYQIKSVDYKKYIGMFFQYSFYLVIIILFSFVFLIILQALGFKSFSFLPDDGGLIQVPLLPTNRQVKFPITLMGSNESADFLNVLPTNYTISMDVFISSDFVNQSTPRVLLYRAPAAVVLDSSHTTIESVAAIMPMTNFILYLDPYTNDLMADVFVIQNGLTPRPSGSSPSGSSPSGTGPSGSTGYTKVSMTRVANVPIRTPFRITMMLSDVLLEIYINGELQKSVPFTFGNSPRSVNTSSNFYGPPAIVRQSVLVSNISFWNTPLSSKSIRVYGKEPLNTKVFSS